MGVDRPGFQSLRTAREFSGCLKGTLDGNLLESACQSECTLAGSDSMVFGHAGKECQINVLSGCFAGPTLKRPPEFCKGGTSDGT
jgi:hypothetical protein